MTITELSAEIRGWTLLCFALVGGIITVMAYIQNQKQRRLENSFRLLGLFEESISEEDRQHWVDLFHATSEPSGAPPGYLIDSTENHGDKISLGSLFAEGPPDGGTVQRMLEFFEMLSLEAKDKTVNLRFLYYHLGHYMDKIFEWVLSFPEGGGSEFLREEYPEFSRLYSEGHIKKSWRYSRRATTG